MCLKPLVPDPPRIRNYFAKSSKVAYESGAVNSLFQPVRG